MIDNSESSVDSIRIKTTVGPPVPDQPWSEHLKNPENKELTETWYKAGFLTHVDSQSAPETAARITPLFLELNRVFEGEEVRLIIEPAGDNEKGGVNFRVEPISGEMDLDRFENYVSLLESDIRN